MSGQKRKPYTPAEDQAILAFAEAHRDEKLGGNSVWKMAERLEVTCHSWHAHPFPGFPTRVDLSNMQEALFGGYYATFSMPQELEEAGKEVFPVIVGVPFGLMVPLLPIRLWCHLCHLQF